VNHAAGAIEERVPGHGPTPLGLLLRVNLAQSWRRLQSVRRQSWLLTLVIAAFLAGYLVLAFALFYHGMRFLKSFPGLGGLLTERMLFLLFAFLFGLLLLSNLIIGYSNLFRNRETAFLWSLPIPGEIVFRWKFIESALLASWAFVFLISPLVVAYGLNQRADWHFYLFTPLAVALFVVLPAVAGTWAAIIVARFIDRRSFQVGLLLLIVGLITLTALWLRPVPEAEELTETRIMAVLDRLLVRTQFALFPLLPSYWLAAAVSQWTEGALRGAGFFLLVLLSHVLLFGFLAFTRLGPGFYEGTSRVQSRASAFGHWQWFRRWRARRERFDWPLGWAEHCFGLLRWLRPDVRALLVKDVRTFWRDTSQWGQTLVLFGLLAVYILNLRHFKQQMTIPFWVHLVSFLNLGACSLNLATLTTRFVYPQFSLEGRRLWLVGMAPMGLVEMIKVKYWLATTASLAVTGVLIGLSCHLLELPWERTVYFTAAVTLMTFTLNGLAAGLGALYPNFREDNPSKIVSGFGGTLCLVLSFLYILASVVLLAVGSPWTFRGIASPLTMGGMWAAFAALSISLGWLPLKAGLRRVAEFEI
jgi:ABC-2 type transport system permease protein